MRRLLKTGSRTGEVLAGRDDFPLEDGGGHAQAMVVTSGPGGVAGLVFVDLNSGAYYFRREAPSHGSRLDQFRSPVVRAE